ncbi:hypothetical protein HDU87_003064 [Geranomyces variabilis]|uniref:DUF5672 domain-containing protein n=1 Tax=Geranomyces variabilis TaxID=109894 RepID=A0AAD5TLZ4_9FUNG|nr:hypothetical protein HDU87_003064 [Geranomyces variabilis]
MPDIRYAKLRAKDPERADPAMPIMRSSRTTLRRLLFPLVVVTLLVLFILAPADLGRRISDLKGPATPKPSSPEPNNAATPAVKNAAADSGKAAVFVEARPLQNMVPVILYFAGILGPTWPIHVYHSDENLGLLNSSAAILQHVERGSIVLHALPTTVHKFNSHDAVSEFLTDPWIWRSLGPAVTHALLFQADSIICGASPLRPENFFEFSFIGAPIAPQYGRGYNGGLSLRHVPTILRTIETFKWAETRMFEDQWFATYIPKLVNPSAPPLPTVEQSKYFSVETIWADKPMGYHQAKRWNSARMSEILEWCPELTLTEAGTLYPK